MNEYQLSLPIDVVPLKRKELPTEYKTLKNIGDNILMITTNKITIRTNEGVIDYWNGYKENYINGDIDIYNRVLVMTSDGRLIFLTRKEIERNTYEETEINYFLPQNLQERNVVVLGLAFYHVESFEIKALVFTSDRSIFSLSFLTNQRPINATTNTVYLSSSKTSPLWCSFGALEIGNGVVATCDSLQIFQTKEGYEIVWNSNKLKNVDSSRPFETYCFSVFAEYDIQTHQQVNKTVSLKKFICKTPFQKYNFVLTPSILNFIDEQNALIQSIPLDGKPVWMTTDQQILWNNIKINTNDKIDLTSFNSFEKLRVGVHRELDSSVGLVKTFVLYCWCVILDVRAIQIATKQKCNEQQEIDILYSTLQNEIPSKTGIDHHIIRYIIRQCGIDSIFIKYCSICNDIEGYIEYLMEREEHDIVFEQLTLLFQESSVFQIPNQRRMAQKLLEEYFSVLFFKNNDKMVEMLSNIEFRTFPSFFTALILYPDTQVSINFAKILLRNYESKGQFNEVICEFIFGSY
ncbi:RING-type domain-containing protein [Entamoeba marina]